MRALRVQTGRYSVGFVARRLQSTTAPSASPSLALGLFSAAFRTSEVIPFPLPKIDEDTHDTLQTLQSQLDKAPRDGVTAIQLLGSNHLSILGASVAPELGGLGLKGPALGFALSSVAACDAALPIVASHVADAVLAEGLLHTDGTKDQRGRWFPNMSDGTMVVAWCDREIGSGDDLSATTTKAVLADTEYRVTGSKRVADPELLKDATHALVVCQVPTQVATAVEGNAPAIKDRLTWLMIDLKAAEVAKTVVRNFENSTIVFSGTAATLDCIVGTVGQGLTAHYATTLTKAPLLSGMVAAAARRFLEATLDELSRLPATSRQCAAASLHVLTSQLYALDTVSGLVAINLDRDVPDAMVECFICMQLASHVVSTCETIARALNLGSDYADRLNRMRRMAARTGPTFDVTRWQAACVGVEDYGLAFSATSTFSTMSSRMQRSLGLREKLKGVTLGSNERQLLEKATEKFNESVERLVVRAGPSAKDRQLALSRLADCNSLLFAAVACLSRADTASRANVGVVETSLALSFSRFTVAIVNEWTADIVNAGRTSDDTRTATFFDTLQTLEL